MSPVTVPEPVIGLSVVTRPPGAAQAVADVDRTVIDDQRGIDIHIATRATSRQTWVSAADIAARRALRSNNTVVSPGTRSAEPQCASRTAATRAGSDVGIALSSPAIGRHDAR